MLIKRSDWPRDPALGNLFEALSPPHLLPVLRQHFATHSARRKEPWKLCRGLEALYDPGDHLQIAYVLHTSESIPAERVWPEGDLIYVRYPVRQTMSRRGTILNVGGHDMEVYAFPNDRRLVGLRKFVRRDRTARVWQQWLSQDEPALELQPETLRRALMRYVPEQKWIARLQARCYDSVTEQYVKRTIALRASDVESCERIYARTIALRRKVNRMDGAFRINKPVALDRTLGLLAMRWVWGDSLLDLLRQFDAGDIMRRVAVGLNVFHQTSIDDLPEVTPQDHLKSATHCARDIGMALPSLTDALGCILDTLSRRCPQNNVPGRRWTVHNDFHWNQLRGRPHRLAILDLERCAIGDRLVDVANFNIQLTMLPLRRDVQVSSAEAKTWTQAFLTAWEHVSSEPIDPNRLAWYTAAALLTLARGMLRHLRDDWPTLVQRFVERAGVTLSHADNVELSA